MRHILFLSLFLVACCIGCGGKGFTVAGKVTFPDGKSLNRGQVTFISDSFTGGGDIIAEGYYRIGGTDGVPAGTYKVTVRAVGESTFTPGTSIADVKLGESMVDLKYNSPETSGLTCEVKGRTTFNITVEPPK